MNIPNLGFDNVHFPDRKSIVKSDAHFDDIVEKAKSIDVDKINFDGEDFQPKTRIIQKQKVYLWIRLYIKEEIEILPETRVEINYLDGLEKLETHFMFFGKKGLERDKDGEIVNFNPEDDKKILCLLLDVHKIDYENEDIPYMKTLFPLGRHYKPQYIKKMEFSFKLDDGTELDFYDVSF